VSLPREAAQALRDVDSSLLPGPLAIEGKVCAGAKFHSPSPLVLHDVTLLNGRVVTLCGCCRDNASVLTALVKTHAQELSWPVRREFGNLLRSLIIPKETDA
jgi:hypothetical protein